MRQSNKVYDAFACIEAGDKLKSFTKDSLKTAWKHKGRRHGIAVYPAFRLAVGMACLLFASALGAGGYAMLLEPVSCVSIDVNPSIELSLNRIDRVISARAYNADGEAVLNALSVKGMYYTDAVDKVVESEAMQPYLWMPRSMYQTSVSSSATSVFCPDPENTVKLDVSAIFPAADGSRSPCCASNCTIPSEKSKYLFAAVKCAIFTKITFSLHHAGNPVLFWPLYYTMFRSVKKI